MGGIGCAISGGKWHFNLTRGGFVLSAALMISGGFWPLLGRWYPETYSNTLQHPKQMGIQASVEWIILLLCYSLFNVPFMDLILWFRMIPVAPFDYFGGGRVFKWNKVVYLLWVAITVVVLRIFGT